MPRIVTESIYVYIFLQINFGYIKGPEIFLNLLVFVQTIFHKCIW